MSSAFGLVLFFLKNCRYEVNLLMIIGNAGVSVTFMYPTRVIILVLVVTIISKQFTIELLHYLVGLCSFRDKCRCSIVGYMVK